jgi:hypothetical protein
MVVEADKTGEARPEGGLIRTLPVSSSLISDSPSCLYLLPDPWAHLPLTIPKILRYSNRTF